MRLSGIGTRIAVAASLRRAAKVFVGLRVTSVDGASFTSSRRLRFTADDPSIIFEFDQPNATGEPCLLVFDATPSRPEASGRLYLDDGHGFSEDHLIAWRYGTAGVSSVALRDPSSHVRLRWIPDDLAGGHIDIRGVFTRPLSPSETANLSDYGSALGEGTNAAGFHALYRSSIAVVRTESGERAERAGEPCVLIVAGPNDAGQLERSIQALGVARDRMVVLDQGWDSRTAKVCDTLGVVALRIGATKTRAQCGNIGLRLAERMKARTLLVTSGHVRFVTGVAHELAAALAQDGGLAIVAPSQVVLDGQAGSRRLAQRAAWDLDSLSFALDFTGVRSDPDRLDADYCDLTCAMLRVSALRAVGGFDETLGPALEDADLCFRLRMAGYAVAALPRSQIENDAPPAGNGAPVDRARERSGRLFARKHLGYGVDYRALPAQAFTRHWAADLNLHARLARDGLIDGSRPQLVRGRPGLRAPNYLLTDRDASTFPSQWREPNGFHRVVLVPSRRLETSFNGTGIAAHRVPPGVDTDVFTPWGPMERLYAGPTYLCWVRDRDRHGLALMLQVWQRFHAGHRDARLIVMGRAVLGQVPGAETGVRQHVEGRSCAIPSQGLLVREASDATSEADLSRILRSVDLLICPTGGDGFGYPVLQAMACGTPTLVAECEAWEEFAHPCSLRFENSTIGEAGASTRTAVALQPDATSLLARLEQAHSLDDHARRLIREAGLHLVRNSFTSRHTSFALRHALTQLQDQGWVGDDRPASMESTAALSQVEVAWSLERGAREQVRERVAASAQRIEASLFEEFDRDYYTDAYPDVAAAGEDPLTHFLNFGWKEERRPSQLFTTTQWLAANAQVRRALLWREGPANDRSLQGPDLAPVDPGPTAPPVIPESRSAAQAGQAREGVLFVGYVEASLGLGQALRGTLTALASSSLLHAIYPFNRHVESRFIGLFKAHLYDQHHAYRVNVFEMAPDQLGAAVGELGSWRTKGNRNILKGYWELPEVPMDWRPALAGMDEIWAPSRFVADAFGRAFTGPITLVPPPVDTSREVCYDRAHFGLPADPFTFLFTFDYASFTARKNPLGVLQAFARAFTRGDTVGLVIKSVGSGRSSPRIKAAIDEACAADPRITVLDAVMSRDEQVSLIDVADCYVSLHRSEGFGLGMAEAMSLGKPVIATDHSGNVDFLSDRTGFPVAFSLRALRHGEYPFSGGQHWAEPDLDSAVEQMRRVVGDPDERRRRARAGQAHIVAHYGADAVRHAIETRVSAILAGASGGPPAPARQGPDGGDATIPVTPGTPGR